MTQPLHEDVVAAVVNYNTAALTLRCVRSLLDAGIPRILVLDNASASADFDLLASRRAAERFRLLRKQPRTLSDVTRSLIGVVRVG